MRRTFVVLLALLAAPLMGASPGLAIKPTVIVYPFTANGTAVDREASSRLATIIAAQMANTKEVNVVPAPSGTERKDYLTVARANHADYYISGYMSALGNGVSLVEQVVSTLSGIVTFSNTAQLQTYADAAGQGDALAHAVAQYANRGLAAIATAPPSTAPAPREPEANLGALLGRGKKGAPKAGPTPAAKATPAAQPPAKLAAAAAASNGPDLSQVAILPVAGSAAPNYRQAATFRIATHIQAPQVDTPAQACAAHPRALLLRGALTEQHPTFFNGGIWKATLALRATDCSGSTLWSTAGSQSASSAEAAIDGAVDAALAQYDKATAAPPPTAL